MSDVPAHNDSQKKNTQATASLVLGLIAFFCSAYNLAPGLFGVLGCLSVAAGVLAIVAGLRGLISTRLYEGQGRMASIAGIVLGVLGIIVFVVVLNIAVQNEKREFERLLTPSATVELNAD